MADRLAIVDALVAAGSDINARRDDGRTIFIDAMCDSYWNESGISSGTAGTGCGWSRSQ